MDKEECHGTIQQSELSGTYIKLIIMVANITKTIPLSIEL